MLLKQLSRQSERVSFLCLQGDSCGALIKTGPRHVRRSESLLLTRTSISLTPDSNISALFVRTNVKQSHQVLYNVVRYDKVCIVEKGTIFAPSGNLSAKSDLSFFCGPLPRGFFAIPMFARSFLNTFLIHETGYKTRGKLPDNFA